MTSLPSTFRNLTIACLTTFLAAALTPSPVTRAQDTTTPASRSDSAVYLNPNGPAQLTGNDEETEPPLLGTIDGTNYISPTGAFRVRIPVYPELGGQINDTKYVATFQDAFGDHYSIGCFPINDEIRAEQAKRNHKDFLIWFFQNYIQADFMRNIPGATAEQNARYNANSEGGALFSVLTLPNGSVFSERVFIFPPTPTPIAKRGNLTFEHDGNIFVISTELSERITSFSDYKKTPDEESEIMRNRVYDMLNHITFASRKTDVGTKPLAAPAAETSASTTPAATPAVTYPAPATSGTK